MPDGLLSLMKLLVAKVCILRRHLTLGISPAGGCCLLVRGSKSITSSTVLLRALVFKGDIVKCDNILLTNGLIQRSLWGKVGRVMW